MFEIYQPRDLTGAARFSAGHGQPADDLLRPPVPHRQRRPGRRRGQGHRPRRSGSTATPTRPPPGTSGSRLGRPPRHRDADQLAQAAGDALAQGAQTVELAATPIDTPTLRYGPDDPAAGVQGYGLGDLVTIEPLPGEQVAQLVREVHLQATPDEGETVTPLVGTARPASDPAWITTVARLERRVAAVERD